MTIGTEPRPRIEGDRFRKDAAQVYAALLAMGDAVKASGLDVALTELVKVRASQVNGCAFCLGYHLDLARRAEVPAQKLDLLATWHEAVGVYSARERVALAWTEALCTMPSQPVDDALWTALVEQFGESEAMFLTAAIANINAWNRIAGALQFTPPRPRVR